MTETTSLLEIIRPEFGPKTKFLGGPRKVVDYLKSKGYKITVTGLKALEKEIGLHAGEREPGGYREYTEKNLLEFEVILTLRLLGFERKEIGAFVKTLISLKGKINEVLTGQTPKTPEHKAEVIKDLIRLTDIEKEVYRRLIQMADSFSSMRERFSKLIDINERFLKKLTE